MARLIGIVLIVLGIWVGVEVYLNGTQGAFGGALAGLGEGPGTAAARDTRTAPQRAGAAVQGAHDQASDRRQRLMGE